MGLWPALLQLSSGVESVVVLMVVPAALQVVGVASSFVPVWRLVSATLAELDLLAAFGEVAAAAPSPYVRPTMLPSEGTSSVRACLPLHGVEKCEM